jgi:hypothetical protein
MRYFESADRFAAEGERQSPPYEQRSLVLRSDVSLASLDLKVVTIIEPETLVRWHRAGFRRYWRWKSRSRGGRPQIEIDYVR